MRETLFKWSQTDFLSLERIELLRAYFGDLETAWREASEEAFCKAGLSRKGLKSFFAKREKIDFKQAEEALAKSGAQMIFIEDENYPQRLKSISAPPIFLFVLGEIKKEDEQSLAVVGSRAFTAQGKEAVARLVPDLVRNKFTIISGLARGIDSLAHKEALRHEGRTLAVLGSGIDHIWPFENKNLAQEIVNNGAIISEFPMGTIPMGFNFPRRNRIVSGLALGVLVVEGKERSGSLITAHTALEQGREVFAIPHNAFTANAQGPNKLIRQGEAKLCARIEDILEEFQMEKVKADEKPLPKDKDECLILGILGMENKLFDEIVQESGLNSALLSSKLTILEMKGYVRNVGMGQWVRV